jgi:FkbM family methyltransferase
MSSKLETLAKRIEPGAIRSGAPDFSFCSLVTDISQYESMIASMQTAGFDSETTEFLYLDNTKENTGDGYRGLNTLANAARGRFIVFCHQDILAIDGPDKLRQVIADLTELDPNWAVIGNAGVRDGQRFLFLNERASVIAGPSRRRPEPVDSLDENFIVLRQDARLGFSTDLEGFHLYGTDLVLQAQVRGLTAYAVDFRVEHLGLGQIDLAFQKSCDALEEKYAKALAPRTLSTTCASLDIGTLTGKGRQRRHRDLTRGLEFVKPSKKMKKKIRSAVSGHSLEVDGLRFQYPEDVTYAAYHALRKGFYELPERNLMKDHLRPDLPVVELGGAYGIVSGLVNRKLNRGLRQIVVEANPKLLDLCKRNAMRGGDDRELTVLNFAVDYSGAESISFNVTKGIHDSHVADSRRSLVPGSSITAPTVTLSQLLEREGINSDYSLVCDIEGAEFDLVAKDAKGLKNCQVMIVELHPSVFYEREETVSSFLANLDAAGFEVLASDATVIAAVRNQPG